MLAALLPLCYHCTMRQGSNSTGRLCEALANAKPAARAKPAVDGRLPRVVASARGVRFTVRAVAPCYAPGRRLLAGGGGGIDRELVRSKDEKVERWELTYHTVPSGQRYLLTVHQSGERVEELVFDTRHAAIQWAESIARERLDWQRERGRGRGRKRVYKKLPNRGHDEPPPAKASGRKARERRRKAKHEEQAWHKQAQKDHAKRGIALVHRRPARAQGAT